MSSGPSSRDLPSSAGTVTTASSDSASASPIASASEESVNEQRRRADNSSSSSSSSMDHTANKSVTAITTTDPTPTHHQPSSVSPSNITTETNTTSTTLSPSTAGDAALNVDADAKVKKDDVIKEGENKAGSPEQTAQSQSQHQQHPFRMTLKTTAAAATTSTAKAAAASSSVRKRKTSSAHHHSTNVFEEDNDDEEEEERRRTSRNNKVAKTAASLSLSTAADDSSSSSLGLTTTTMTTLTTSTTNDHAAADGGGESNSNSSASSDGDHDDGDIDDDDDDDDNDKNEMEIGTADVDRKSRRKRMRSQKQQAQQQSEQEPPQQQQQQPSTEGDDGSDGTPQQSGNRALADTVEATTLTEEVAGGENRDNNKSDQAPHSPTTISSSAAAASPSTTAAGTQQTTPSTPTTPPLEQPEGWRVKLYRLNADGSWDDCGTGRIVCLYRPHPTAVQQHQRQQQEQQQQHHQASEKDGSNADENTSGGSSSSTDDADRNANDSSTNSTTATTTAATLTEDAATAAKEASPSQDQQAQQQQQNNEDGGGSNEAATMKITAAASSAQTTATTATSSANTSNNTDHWLHQETGEATLCVQAEVTKQNRQPRVLLRTRILLRDAYQRQGDNIITWCEPTIGTGGVGGQQQQQQQANRNNANAGSSNNNNGMACVDLALSFQDNAGCLDIWRQITHVQGRAAELMRQHHQQHGSSNSSSSDGGNHSMTATAAAVAAQHHADLDKQERDNFWGGGSNNNNNHSHVVGGVIVSSSLGPSHQQHHHHHHRQHDHVDDDGDDGENNVFMDGGQGIVPSCSSVPVMAMQLPNPPTLHNLEEIADGIAAMQHVQQRDSLAMWIAKDECSYLKALLALFPAAEDRGDYGKLATLAACVKTILLLNDPSILELIVTVADMFEQVCSCLEYDPDLREKANHRWFLRERAKFRTVVAMDDPDLVAAIHRSFRVNYLRDTLLRPTMDESSLSTLSSLQTFSHADVVKGVTMSSNGKEVSLTDSYLVRVIRMLGMELHALSVAEWADLEVKHYHQQQQQLQQQLQQQQQLQHSQPHHHESSTAGGMNEHPKDSFGGCSRTMDLCHVEEEDLGTDPSIVVGKHSLGTATWKQYLAPQDSSLTSRRLRRRGCLSFLRELFNMVRVSLQQSDKDDFFSVICTLDVDLNEERDISDNVSQTSQTVEVGSVASTVRSDRLDEQGAHFELPAPTSPVNLLALLGNVLSDPNTDVSEKSSVLEIIAGVAMHDPTFIRRHCLEYHAAWKNTRKDGSSANGSSSGNVSTSVTAISGRPEPSEKKQVIFFCPPNDLLASLIFLLDVETDAGVLLQVTEIMRIILDTDMMGCDNGSLNAGFADEAEVPAALGGHPHGNGGPPTSPHEQHGNQSPHSSVAASTDQKHFLSMFYEHYVEWLVAPFQFTILHPIRRVPDHVLRSPPESNLMQKMLSDLQKGISPDDTMVRTIPGCAIRSSFAVELLSFCVRAHLYRMKFFLLKSRVLGSVLNLLSPRQRVMTGDRCLKLAALRFLRSILSVNDEFYHRHIIQHNLFEPVFEAFRANPVGDNLVSSAIVEMCDYIHSENIKSLLEYIVTRHLSATPHENEIPSLEDVSSPYVSTLTVLRKAYEDNLNATQLILPNHGITDSGQASPGGSRYFPPSGGGGGTQQQQHDHHAQSQSQQQHQHRPLSGAALEDQRKFREADQEESYFDSDDTDETPTTTNTSSSLPLAVDEVAVDATGGPGGAAVATDLRRTPRMFSLAQAPLLNNLDDSNTTGGGEASPTSAMTDNDETILPEPSSATMSDET